MSCPKTRKSHSPCTHEMKIFFPLWINLKLPQSLSQVPLSLPWSFIECKSDTCLSPKATFPGEPCIVGNLLRMLLPSGPGCLEVLNYCDLPLGWAKNRIPKPGPTPRKIPWHFSQNARIFEFCVSDISSFNICKWKLQAKDLTLFSNLVFLCLFFFSIGFDIDTWTT